MATTSLITDKVHEVIDEMKESGLWRKHPPAWVSEYQENNFSTENDFSEWLQFVYLPNLSQQAENSIGGIKKNFIVPQAIRFFGDDIKKGKLLRLLVELDSMY